MGIPFELITFLGSTGLGGIMQLVSMKMKDKARLEQFKLAAMTKSNQAVADARNYKGDKGFNFTRRTIALSSVFAIIILPLVAQVFGTFPVTTGYTEFHPGLLFMPDKDILVWKEATGFVITPMHTNLVSAIMGLYFGSSTVKN